MGRLIQWGTLHFASVVRDSYDNLGSLDFYDKCHAFVGYSTVSLTLPHGTDKARTNKEILQNKI